MAFKQRRTKKPQSIVNCPHTSLEHFAKGFCKSCYNHVWYEEKKRRASGHSIADTSTDFSLSSMQPARESQSPSHCPHVGEAVCRGLCLECYHRSNNRWWGGVLGGQSYTIRRQSGAKPLLSYSGPLGRKRAEKWILSVLDLGSLRVYRQALSRLRANKIDDKGLREAGVVDSEHRRLLLSRPPTFVKINDSTCSVCQEKGHRRGSCPNASQDISPRTRQAETPAASAPRRCAQCGKQGHYRNACPMYGTPNYSAYKASKPMDKDETPLEVSQQEDWES